MKILILCTGNSCRSQMTHGFLNSFDEKLQVFSGGTEPATQINPKATEVMAEIGVDISSHTPDNVSKFIAEKWDFVITVCGEADKDCPNFNGEVKTRLHIGFEDPSDAVGTDEFIMSEFRRVRDLIKATFSEFYNKEVLKLS